MPEPRDIIASTVGLERLRRSGSPLADLPVAIDDARLYPGVVAVRYSDDSTRFLMID
jgi:hypothetical protein